MVARARLVVNLANNLPTGCHSLEGAAAEQAAGLVGRALPDATLAALKPSLRGMGTAQLRVFKAHTILEGHHGDDDEVVDSALVVAVPRRAGEFVRHRVGCRAFFEFARRTLKPKTLTNGTFRLRADLSRLRAGDVVLYDDRAEVCDTSNVRQREIVSWVGPIVTVAHDSEIAGYRTSAVSGWRTHDITSGPAPASLLIEEASLVDALKQDPWVRRQVDSLKRSGRHRNLSKLVSAFESAASETEIFTALAALLDLQTGFEGSGVGYVAAYAFHSYDAANNRVAIRLAIPRFGGPGLRDQVVLGLSVTPKTASRSLFETAAKNGWLMSSADREAGVPGTVL